MIIKIVIILIKVLISELHFMKKTNQACFHDFVFLNSIMISKHCFDFKVVREISK